MDPTEQRALEFLHSRGYWNAVYEPDGNVPPDFAFGHIAVEVRRLNQHDLSGRGLEVSALPLAMKFRNLLTSLGPPQGPSWFVTFRYRRPIEKWSALSGKIKKALSAFRQRPSEEVDHLPISDRFSLGLARSSKAFESFFVLGGYTDHDAGGWITAETIKNLAIVIPEKSAKVERFHAKYVEWWLVLVDHISYARFEDHELSALREHVKRPAAWNKIFLVNPLAPHHAIEI